MANAGGNAKAYAPVAGDRFILKGRDSWARASFPCTWRGSGSNGNPIYVGVDQSWFSGTAWSRPVFDVGNAHINSTHNVVLDFRNSDYLTLDNIEFVNFKATNWTTYGECAMIEAVGDQNVTIDHIFVHNFSID